MQVTLVGTLLFVKLVSELFLQNKVLAFISHGFNVND